MIPPETLGPPAGDPIERGLYGLLSSDEPRSERFDYVDGTRKGPDLCMNGTAAMEWLFAPQTERLPNALGLSYGR